MKFTSNPITIDAIQFTGDNNAEVIEFVRNNGGNNAVVGDFFRDQGGFSKREWELKMEYNGFPSDVIAVVYDYLHNTWVGVKIGQWIIKGTKGEFYPCDHDVFVEKYNHAKDQVESDLVEDEDGAPFPGWVSPFVFWAEGQTDLLNFAQTNPPVRLLHALGLDPHVMESSPEGVRFASEPGPVDPMTYPTAGVMGNYEGAPLVNLADAAPQDANPYLDEKTRRALGTWNAAEPDQAPQGVADTLTPGDANPNVIHSQEHGGNI